MCVRSSIVELPEGVLSIYNTQQVAFLNTTYAFKESLLIKAGNTPPIQATKKYVVENFMTLKQACSLEYQGAQDAFKNSMIH